jgi:hypothetical protein
MVLDPPDRLEAERLGEVGESQLVGVDLAVGPRLARVLEDGRHSDVHGTLPFRRCIIAR